MVYMRRKVTMTIAPPRVKPGLVHSLKFDLSALLMGSTSSDNGKLDRLGFQLTYLSGGVNCESRLFFPCFLKLDQALSQSVVENLSAQNVQKQYQQQCICVSHRCLICLYDKQETENINQTTKNKQKGSINSC